MSIKSGKQCFELNHCVISLIWNSVFPLVASVVALFLFSVFKRLVYATVASFAIYLIDLSVVGQLAWRQKLFAPGCSMQFCWLTHAASAVYNKQKKHTHCIPYTHFHCSERDSCMGNFCSIAAGIELHSPLAFLAVSILYVCVNSFSSPLPFSL